MTLNDAGMIPVHAIISVAMPEEAQPFLDMHKHTELEGFGSARFYLLERGEEQLPFLLIQSGVGLVAAASALAAALCRYATTRVISAGTCGGLYQASPGSDRPSVNVGDICASTRLAYTDADATAFGYERGQTPGQPAVFESHLISPEHSASVINSIEEKYTLHCGLMLAGNSFVTEANVKDTREAFPDAISTDMESTALAQVCHHNGLEFLSLRAVSDLCGPEAGQDFHMDCDMAAARSAEAVRRLFSVIEA